MTAPGSPWCDGNVVPFGTTYDGITQPLVATRQPPALRGFSRSRCEPLLTPLVQRPAWGGDGGDAQGGAGQWDRAKHSLRHALDDLPARAPA
jgi:X-Pro dipeptidyl-peptidase (S15 family)